MFDGLIISAVLLFALGFVLMGLRLLGRDRVARVWVMLVGFAAIVVQAEVLHLLIDTVHGQNLSMLNMLSMACWLVTALVLLLGFLRKVDVLFLLLFPLSAITLVIAGVSTHPVLVFTRSSPGDLFHILLGILTFCVICVAGLQALILALKDRVLKRKYDGVWSRYLPPLDEMERTLFQTVWLSFILLTVMVVSSLYLFYPILFTYPGLIRKTAFGILAWLVFGGLLFGRYVFGWRGRLAIYGTAFGVWILVLIYFGVAGA